MILTPDDLNRYSRQMAMPEFGATSQVKLKQAKVLCIGAGGLGSPALLYLTAAGIGTIGIVEADTVDLSNLQRQILYTECDVHQSKALAAKHHLQQLNKDIQIQIHQERFTIENAAKITQDYDIIIDGTDNFTTRYLSNDVCFFQKKINIYASILRFEGQVSVFASHLGTPCYRCLLPQAPDPSLVPSCAEAGVLGVLPGIIGSMQALEAIKIITGLGAPLYGQLLHFNALRMRFRSIQLNKDPNCPLCGKTPSIFDLKEEIATCSTYNSNATSEITVQDLHQQVAINPQISIIDVRERSEYQFAHLNNSFLLPLSELDKTKLTIDPNKTHYIHCKSGVRSLKAIQYLQQQGFTNLVQVKGGIDAWIQANYPVSTEVPA
jgi:adenylyltransferase/sulfurtransferase